MVSRDHKRAMSRKQRCVLVFLVGLIAGGAAAWLIHTSRHGAGVFSVDKQFRARKKVPAAERWAKRIELAEVPNFHKVSADLYRGAQPSEEGMRQLEGLGIKTVVNLRLLHSDREAIENTGLEYEHIGMEPWDVDGDEVISFLKIVGDANRTPVFVHCRRGADRTGLVCAVYRVVVQGWSRDEAIEEMTEGGFGFYSTWQNIIDYIRKLDIEEVRSQAGLKE
ncbi:MAG: fused DSP-PTPase phosphatase/NAD kinase-like protein [Planctomycetota bacterium]